MSTVEQGTETSSSRRVRRTRLMVLAAGAVTLACSGFAVGRAVATNDAGVAVPTSVVAPTTPAGASTAVEIVDFAFAPASITVKAGTPVAWSNADSFAHSIRSNDGAFAEQTMTTGATATVTFAKPGTYPYICGIHNSMTGTVVVEQ